MSSSLAIEVGYHSSTVWSNQDLPSSDEKYELNPKTLYGLRKASQERNYRPDADASPAYVPQPSRETSVINVTSGGDGGKRTPREDSATGTTTESGDYRRRYRHRSAVTISNEKRLDATEVVSSECSRRLPGPPCRSCSPRLIMAWPDRLCTRHQQNPSYEDVPFLVWVPDTSRTPPMRTFRFSSMG